ENPLFSRLSTSLDYYSIEITDVVGTITAANQLQGCFNATGVTNTSYDANNGYCQLFRRDAMTGNVVDSLGLQQHLATLKPAGVGSARWISTALITSWMRSTTSICWAPGK